MILKFKNILITGSEGFVGKRLNPFLRDLGYKITCLDKINFNQKKIILCDLASDDAIKVADILKNKKIDLLIHLAAAKGDYNISPKIFYRDNVEATRNLVKILVKLSIKNVIHYSTVSVYGHDNKLTNEDAPLVPNNYYGKTKLESEKILIKWQKQNTSNLTILRPSVIYGENNYANMYNLISMLAKPYPVTIGKNNYVKSVTAIENILDITFFSMKKLKLLQIYNCTDEPYHKLSELMDFICSIEGYQLPKLRIPILISYLLALPFEFLSFVLKKDFMISIERINKFAKATDYRSKKIRKFGYVQRFKTSDSIKKMTKWHKSLKK